MKYILLKSFLLLISFNYSFSQCPHPGLNIQSTSCDSARNLQASAISCSQIKVQWQGSGSQSYVVRAIGITAANNASYEAGVSNYSCSKDGNCEAIITVKENSILSWSVQSACTQSNGTIYGFQANGKQVTVPFCSKNDEAKAPLGLHVYPNPTTGSLTVDYKGTLTALTRISIFDMAGKKVYSVAGNAVSHTGTAFRLDLHALISGNYTLQVSNGKEISQAKFILMVSR